LIRRAARSAEARARAPTPSRRAGAATRASSNSSSRPESSIPGLICPYRCPVEADEDVALGEVGPVQLPRGVRPRGQLEHRAMRISSRSRRRPLTIASATAAGESLGTSSPRTRPVSTTGTRTANTRMPLLASSARSARDRVHGRLRGAVDRVAGHRGKGYRRIVASGDDDLIGVAEAAGRARARCPSRRP
jgi:hypothetical protein